jgi:hypothetical protein
MADLKISQLTDGNAAQAADEFVVARSGGNFRIDGASVAAAATSVGTLSSLTVSGNTILGAEVFRGADNSFMRIAGGNPSSTGANYIAFGSTHATAPGRIAINAVGTGHIEFNAGGAQRALLDASGNLGLGVTPSAWGGGTGFDVGSGAAVWGLTNTSVPNAYFGSNNYFDGSVYKYKHSAFATSYAQFEGKHAWYTAASGTAGNAITFTQAMTLDASGNLLVGATANTTSGFFSSVPRATFSAIGDISFRLHRSTAGGGNGIAGLSFAGNNASSEQVDVAIIRAEITSNSDAGALLFQTLPSGGKTGTITERARITSGGYFKASNTGGYLNSTSSSHEARSSAADESVLQVSASSASYASVVLDVSCSRDTSNATYILIGARRTGPYVFQVLDSGNALNTNGTYGTISDERLKQDIVDAGSAWDDLKAVRFRKYRLKSDVAANPDAPAMLGVVAQEIEQVMPGLVDEHPDTEQVEVPVLDEDGNETGEVTTEQRPTGTTTKSVKSSILLMKAAVALQEAMARIEALEARLEALEA